MRKTECALARVSLDHGPSRVPTMTQVGLEPSDIEQNTWYRFIFCDFLSIRSPGGSGGPEDVPAFPLA